MKNREIYKCIFHKKIFMKFTIIFAYIFIISALIIIYINGTANGYEISIYNQYSLLFWALIFFGVGTSLSLNIWCSIFENKSKIWKYNSFLLFLINIIILFIPLIRNYYFTSFGDDITHIGMIKDILISSHIGISNYYPITHIYTSEITLITTINLNDIIKIVPIFYYCLYLMGLLLIFRIIGNNSQKILGISLSFVFIFTYYTYLFLPTHLFLYLIPLLLAIMYKNIQIKSLSWKTSLFVIIILFPLFHPLGCLFTIIILTLFGIFTLISNKKIFSDKIKYENKFDFFPIIILGILFIFWFLQFYIFINMVNTASGFITEGEGEIPISTAHGITEKLYLSELIDIGFKTFGQIFIFSFLSVIGIILLLFWLLHHRPVCIHTTFFATLFLIFSFIYIFSIFVPFTRTGYSIRIFCWALLASVIFIGLIFGSSIPKLPLNYRKIVTTLFILIIISSYIIGTYNLYNSPYIKKVNLQVSNQEWQSMEWLYTNKDENPTYIICQLAFRAPHGLFGFDSPYPDNLGEIFQIPPHFGYDEYHFFNETGIQKGYLAIMSYDKDFYSKVWTQRGTFTKEEFNHLKSDFSINRVYFNGDGEIWKI